MGARCFRWVEVDLQLKGQPRPVSIKYLKKREKERKREEKRKKRGKERKGEKKREVDLQLKGQRNLQESRRQTTFVHQPISLSNMRHERE